MLVIAVNNAPANLRGRLAVWLLEIRAGIYDGRYSVRVRERIWAQVEAGIQGDTVICWASPSDQGFDFATVGHICLETRSRVFAVCDAARSKHRDR